MAESLYSIETNSMDNLLAGDYPITKKAITVLTGEGALTRGTLLGKVKKTCPTTGTAGTNSGTGTCGSVTQGKKSVIGTYTIRCEDATVEGSETWGVFTPNGERLYTAVTGVAFVSNHINFTITATATKFVVGDSFTVAVAAGSLKYKKALLAAVDGSQDLDTAIVLARDIDATSADIVTIAYETGIFNYNEMTFGTGFTYANTIEELAKRGIFLRDAIQA